MWRPGGRSGSSGGHGRSSCLPASRHADLRRGNACTGLRCGVHPGAHLHRPSVHGRPPRPVLTCLRATHPVLSVNGNAAALVPEDLVSLSEIASAPLEVNIFHTSSDRERSIARYLQAHGATTVLLPDGVAALEGIDSNRRFVHPDGILQADVIFVPLEDGDRCQALRRLGREVLTVDLNPLSRTARAATVTIVDNVSRALPELLQQVRRLRGESPDVWERIVTGFDNAAVLTLAEDRIRSGSGV